MMQQHLGTGGVPYIYIYVCVCITMRFNICAGPPASPLFERRSPKLDSTDRPKKYPCASTTLRPGESPCHTKEHQPFWTRAIAASWISAFHVPLPWASHPQAMKDKSGTAGISGSKLSANDAKHFREPGKHCFEQPCKQELSI